MPGNFFREAIPPSLVLYKGIQNLDLSRNNLSRKFSDFLVAFNSWQILNLYYNNFEDMVPVHGVFKNSATLVVGNNRLCGGIL